MAVMASWNGKTWGVSSQRIAALNGVSSSVELDTENSDDKAGSPGHQDQGAQAAKHELRL